MLNAVQTGTRTFDGATVHVHADVAAMARAAADEALAVLRAAGGGPGHGPRHVRHRQLAAGLRATRWSTRPTACPWADIVVFHMDEYVGVGPDHPAGFQRWIRERIVEPARSTAPPTTSRVWPTPRPSAARYADLLRQHPLDLCCLGIGENGHLAFNDPPVADFADPLRRQGGRARRCLPHAAGARGPLPRPRRRPGPRHHRDHPGARCGPAACWPSSPSHARRSRWPAALTGPDHDRVPGLGTADDLHHATIHLEPESARLLPGLRVLVVGVSGRPITGDVVKMMDRVVEQVAAEARGTETGAVTAPAPPEPLLTADTVEGTGQPGGGGVQLQPRPWPDPVRRSAPRPPSCPGPSSGYSGSSSRSMSARRW